MANNATFERIYPFFIVKNLKYQHSKYYSLFNLATRYSCPRSPLTLLQ